MRAILSLVAGVALAGCAAPVAVRPDVASGPVPVTVEGQDFVAGLHRGGPGVRLTEGGAVPTAGLAVTVARPAGFPGQAAVPVVGAATVNRPQPLGQADGRIAKGAAQAACGASGGRFDPAAIGKVSSAGRWTFEGACS